MKQNVGLRNSLWLAISLVLIASCEKPLIDDSESGNIKENENEEKVQTITFNANGIEQLSFSDGNELQSPSYSRGSVSLADVCKRLSFAVFDESGVRVGKTLYTTSTDKNFGQVSVSLSEGTYTFVFIADNGAGNPTITSPKKITFKDNKVTDTFYYCGDLTIDDGSASEYDVELKRAVAMFRLVVSDATPEDIKQMKFNYTGGSSTFDATTGYGCVNSTQTEYRSVVSDAYEGSSSYDVYTFPHEDGKPLQMKISALAGQSATAAVKYMRTIDNVPVEKNVITRYSGYFYGESPEGGRSFGITIEEGRWEENDYEY